MFVHLFLAFSALLDQPRHGPLMLVAACVHTCAKVPHVSLRVSSWCWWISPVEKGRLTINGVPIIVLESAKQARAPIWAPIGATALLRHAPLMTQPFRSGQRLSVH